MSLVSVTKLLSLMLASVAEQASLSLTWSEIPDDTFSHDEAHMYRKQVITSLVETTKQICIQFSLHSILLIWPIWSQWWVYVCFEAFDNSRLLDHWIFYWWFIGTNTSSQMILYIVYVFWLTEAILQQEFVCAVIYVMFRSFQCTLLEWS